MRNRIPKADNSQKQPLPWLLRTLQKDPATKLWHICWGPSKSHADSLVDSSVSLSRLEPKFIDSGYHLWVPLMPLDPTIFPPTLPQDSQTQPNAGLWVTASVLISYWMKPLMKFGQGINIWIQQSNIRHHFNDFFLSHAWIYPRSRSYPNLGHGGAGSIRGGFVLIHGPQAGHVFLLPTPTISLPPLPKQIL